TLPDRLREHLPNNINYPDPSRIDVFKIRGQGPYLDYPDNRADSVPKWIQLEANGKDGFHLGTSRLNPDHAAQVIRRQRGIH
ncbi:hypothetical protein ACFVYE_46375, partial [Streptomyces sp. NPDC058239]|uniref:hypothetical protein n=1 Tax=Streptomyces sp. NPDC058239 TaxID=3346395 RepID=UPI0036E57A7C